MADESREREGDWRSNRGLAYVSVAMVFLLMAPLGLSGYVRGDTIGAILCTSAYEPACEQPADTVTETSYGALVFIGIANETAILLHGDFSSGQTMFAIGSMPVKELGLYDPAGAKVGRGENIFFPPGHPAIPTRHQSPNGTYGFVFPMQVPKQDGLWVFKDELQATVISTLNVSLSAVGPERSSPAASSTDPVDEPPIAVSSPQPKPPCNEINLRTRVHSTGSVAGGEGPFVVNGEYDDKIMASTSGRTAEIYCLDTHLKTSKNAWVIHFAFWGKTAFSGSAYEFGQAIGTTGSKTKFQLDGRPWHAYHEWWNPELGLVRDKWYFKGDSPYNPATSQSSSAQSTIRLVLKAAAYAAEFSRYPGLAVIPEIVNDLGWWDSSTYIKVRDGSHAGPGGKTKDYGYWSHTTGEPATWSHRIDTQWTTEGAVAQLVHFGGRMYTWYLPENPSSETWPTRSGHVFFDRDLLFRRHAL